MKQPKFVVWSRSAAGEYPVAVCMTREQANEKALAWTLKEPWEWVRIIESEIELPGFE